MRKIKTRVEDVLESWEQDLSQGSPIVPPKNGVPAGVGVLPSWADLSSLQPYEVRFIHEFVTSEVPDEVERVEDSMARAGCPKFWSPNDNPVVIQIIDFHLTTKHMVSAVAGNDAFLIIKALEVYEQALRRGQLKAAIDALNVVASLNKEMREADRKRGGDAADRRISIKIEKEAPSAKAPAEKKQAPVEKEQPQEKTLPPEEEEIGDFLKVIDLGS